MKIKCIYLIPLILTITQASWADQTVDNITFSRQVISMQGELSTKVARCKTTLPSKSDYIEMYEHLWKLTNDMEITAASQLILSQPERQKNIDLVTTSKSGRKFEAEFSNANPLKKIRNMQ